MGDILDVSGLDKLAAVSKALRDAPKELRREMFREMNTITKPLREEMRAEIPNALPRRGGLAAYAQKNASFTAGARGGGQSFGASIRVRGRRGMDARMLNSGRVRHPLFGIKGHWFDQTSGVRKKALGRVFLKGKGHLVRELDVALDRVAEKIARAAK